MLTSDWAIKRYNQKGDSLKGRMKAPRRLSVQEPCQTSSLTKMKDQKDLVGLFLQIRSSLQIRS